MEKKYVESKPKHQITLELNFEDINWPKNFIKIVEDLQEHEIYKNHFHKTTNENDKWGRTKAYQKQLEEFKEFQDYTLNQIKGLSTNDVQKGQKIFKAVKKELYRLQEALPIYAHKSEIIDKIKNNRVVIVEGKTGCGKSTQIIQYLLEIDESENKIALSQPFRHSLGIIALRIEEETGMEVGLVPKHMHNLVSNAKLEIHTFKSLIRQNLSKYSYIIIDDEHHRYVYSDMVFIVLKEALNENPHLRLIITSVAVDQKIFKRFFEREIPKINVSDISHNVEIKYSKYFVQNKFVSKYKTVNLQTLMEIF